MVDGKKNRYKGLEDLSEILSQEPNNIYRNLFSQILGCRIVSFQDYDDGGKKEIGEVLGVLKTAGLIDSSGGYYYPTSYGLRKGRQFDILETPRAWF